MFLQLPVDPKTKAFILNEYNQAVDPDSQVLSQAGDSNPEDVAIDISWETNN